MTVPTKTLRTEANRLKEETLATKSEVLDLASQPGTYVTPDQRVLLKRANEQLGRAVANFDSLIRTTPEDST